MSTTDYTDSIDTSEVTTEQLLDRQRGLEARIEKVEHEVESLREDLERVNDNAATESAINILIDDLVGNDVDVDFEKDPAFNRSAIRTIDERLEELEAIVELLQHDRAEVSE